jgi:hypothetical protein
LKRSLLILSLTAAFAAAVAACGGDDNKNDATPTVAVQPSPTRGAVNAPTSTPSGAQTPAAQPAIAINAPLGGQQVRPPFRVEGVADVFEAALVVQVVGPDGKVLCERAVQATSGSGTAGTWQTTMAFAPLKEGGAGTVRAFDRSAKDGSEENVVTRAIQITNEVAPIVITSPGCNAQVQAQTALEVSGTASVFEAALLVDLRDRAGAVIKTQQVMASAGAPDTGTWTTSFDLAALPTGDYEIVAYNTSARDGSVQNVFAIPVRVTT